MSTAGLLYHVSLLILAAILGAIAALALHRAKHGPEPHDPKGDL
jgi:hypothetical protein